MSTSTSNSLPQEELAGLQARPSLPKTFPSCGGKKAITLGMDSWIHGLTVSPSHQTPGDMFLEGF